MRRIMIPAAFFLAIIGLTLIARAAFQTDLTFLGGKPRPPQAVVGKGFDFYVLALSWSPSYCAQDRDRPTDDSQCGGSQPHGFVVHGLWPQFENGYPRACATYEAGPSKQLVHDMQDIMPSPRLVRLAWERHGTCSGLSAEDYFKAVRKAQMAVEIPTAYLFQSTWRSLKADAIERDFVKQNPSLGVGGIAVERRGSLLSEVRICFTRTIQFRECPEVDSQGVPAGSSLRLPPVGQGQQSH